MLESSNSSISNDSIFLISDLLLPLHKEEEKTNSICCFYTWFQRCFQRCFQLCKKGLKIILHY